MLGAGRVGTTLAWLVAAVAAVIESIGYDVVAMASLRAGRALQPGGPVFGASLRRDEFALAVRTLPPEHRSNRPPEPEERES